jgi:LPS export ABC transporter permease LptG/LPS export ABC transporter permease LptF
MRLRRPRLIWTYVFREVFSPTLIGLGVYVLVFLMNALFELAELAIKKDLPIHTVALILVFYLPRVLIMSLPMAILLGTLVGIGRMSADSEIVALRACGVSYRSILAPVLSLGVMVWLFGSYLIIDMEPRANYSRRKIYNEVLYSADIRREIKPRVFFEEMPGMLLYADQVHQGGDFLEKVFIHQSTEDGKELVTVARRAQIEYDRRDGVAHFYLEGGTTHSTNPAEPESYQVSNFEREMILKEPDQTFRMRSTLLARPAPKNFREQTLRELSKAATDAEVIEHPETRNRVIGTIVGIMHERFALPFASLVFAILGLPLGIMNRRGGKASGFSLSIAIAIVYWILLSTGQNLVSQGRLSPYIGMWTGNILLGILGIVLFRLRERSETLHPSLLIPGSMRRFLARLLRRDLRLVMGGGDPQGQARSAPDDLDLAGDSNETVTDATTAGTKPRQRRIRLLLAGGLGVIGLLALAINGFWLRIVWSRMLENDLLGVGVLVAITLLTLVLVFSTTLDRYVLRRFGVVLLGCVATLITLFAVYEFIQLIDDLVERSLPISLALTYLKYRSPWMMSQVLPMSCLVSTLMTFGIMSRFNEVTAVKASGTSIYRLAIPVLMVTLVLSTVAYVNQDYVMPYANIRANQIKDLIRGRGPRSYEPRERRWVFGDGGRLYTFSNYTPSPIPILPVGGGTFQGFSEYRLDEGSFEIKERLYARSAVYLEGRWVLKDGWLRQFQDGGESFETFAEKQFDFPEGAAYFIKEWKTPEQMTYSELNRFIRDLKRRGYDVQDLTVDLYGKAAFPLVSLTMVILGLPFCFRMGRRGSLYGIGIAIALVAIFILTFSTTNALGAIGLVPPFLAAWAPNILFAGSGAYLLLRTGT